MPETQIPKRNMIKKDEIVEIGKFLKTHALKGELNALLTVEDDYVTDGHPLVVEMDGIFVPFYAESIRPKGAESALIKLKGIDSQDDARQFVNKAIYGMRSDLVDYFDDPELELVADFVDFTIVDSRLGEIGKVVDVDDTTANVLFIVEAADGRRIYVPAAEEFIDAINDERQIIETTLPDGLVDLN